MNTAKNRLNCSAIITPTISRDNTSTTINWIIWMNNFSDILSFRVNSLDDLIKYNNLVNWVINEIMIHDYNLCNRSEKFLEAFKSWLLSKHPIEDPDNEDRKDLMILLEKKSAQQQLLLTESIKNWNINLLWNDLEDLMCLVKCWIIDWMNWVYKTLEKWVKLHWEKNELWESINYWLPSENWPKWYQDTFEWVNIDENLLSKINNPFLREYLCQIFKLSRSWNYKYEDWIKAEINEVNSWLSTEQLAFIAPMENYKHKNYIDPDFLILLREKMSKKSWDYADLSARIFWEEYWMKNVNIYLAEPIMGWWEQTYNKFMWKSFPNDMELREKYGNFIIIIKWQIHKAFDEYNEYVLKIFDIKKGDLINNRSEIIEKIIEEVTYHEYGHSIFTTQHQNMLEETKATLFYWTYLYEKYIANNESLDKEEIKRIIQAFTLDFTRYITRLKIPKYRKYVYTAQILLKHMIDNKILKYDESTNILQFNYDENLLINFKDMLIELREVTQKVKIIYDNKDKLGEEEMIKHYNDATLDVLNNLFSKF